MSYCYYLPWHHFRNLTLLTSIANDCCSDVGCYCCSRCSLKNCSRSIYLGNFVSANFYQEQLRNLPHYLPQMNFHCPSPQLPNSFSSASFIAAVGRAFSRCAACAEMRHRRHFLPIAATATAAVAMTSRNYCNGYWFQSLLRPQPQLLNYWRSSTFFSLTIKQINK